MTQVTPPPQSGEVDTVFTLGMRSGAATTIEVGRTYGWETAAAMVDEDTSTTFDLVEVAFINAVVRNAMRDAVSHIMAARHGAFPDDLSNFPETTASPCFSPSCSICYRADEEGSA